MTRRVVTALMTILLAAPLYADFGTIARSLDARLGSRTWIPFLGFGRFLVCAVHPKGVHDFQLAVFERRRRDVDPAELEELMRRGAGKEFSRLVRVVSQRTGETIVVYARPRGNNIELIVLSHERDETVLVRVVANAEIVAREFGDPRGVVKLASR
jgi:hypothetical protein